MILLFYCIHSQDSIYASLNNSSCKGAQAVRFYQKITMNSLIQTVISEQEKGGVVIIIELMNLFDELGNITPRTQGGINRQPDARYQEQVMENRLHTESGLDDAPSAKKEEMPTGWTRFIKLTYYKQYFQITEPEVIERIAHSISIPHGDSFLTNTLRNPDFYGPFWIMTTLIMLLGFAGNLSNYLLSKFSSGEVWDKYFFKLEFIREALMLVYTFGLGVPVAFYFMLKLKAEKVELGLQNLICLYGYALFCFLPAVAVCVLPISFIQWLCLLYALANSTLFLRTNLMPHVNGIGQMVVTGAIAGTQFVFILCLKFIFLELLTPK